MCVSPESDSAEDWLFRAFDIRSENWELRLHSSISLSFVSLTSWLGPIHFGGVRTVSLLLIKTHLTVHTGLSYFDLIFYLLFEHLKNTILTIFHIILLIIFLHSNLHSNLCNAIIILLIRIRSLYTLVYYTLTLYMLYLPYYNSLHFTYRNKPNIYIYTTCFFRSVSSYEHICDKNKNYLWFFL